MTGNVESTHRGSAGFRRPLVARVMGVFNTIPKLILRSPFHGIMSNRLMLLTFTGRSTGRSYMTPVSYLVEESGSLLIAGRAPWWKNIRNGKVDKRHQTAKLPIEDAVVTGARLAIGRNYQ